MTNVKISKRGREILRNKAVSSAIARALSERAHEAARGGILVIVDGKEYLVKTASALTEKDIASMSKR
jgi:hypothetical protein